MDRESPEFISFTSSTKRTTSKLRINMKSIALIATFAFLTCSQWISKDRMANVAIKAVVFMLFVSKLVVLLVLEVELINSDDS